jgi:hypothetical protein
MFGPQTRADTSVSVGIERVSVMRRVHVARTRRSPWACAKRNFSAILTAVAIVYAVTIGNQAQLSKRTTDVLVTYQATDSLTPAKISGSVLTHPGITIGFRDSPSYIIVRESVAQESAITVSCRSEWSCCSVHRRRHRGRSNLARVLSSTPFRAYRRVRSSCFPAHTRYSNDELDVL